MSRSNFHPSFPLTLIQNHYTTSFSHHSLYSAQCNIPPSSHPPRYEAHQICSNDTWPHKAEEPDPCTKHQSISSPPPAAHSCVIKIGELTASQIQPRKEQRAKESPIHQHQPQDHIVEMMSLYTTFHQHHHPPYPHPTTENSQLIVENSLTPHNIQLPKPNTHT